MNSMENSLREQARLVKARRKAKEIKDFSIHLTLYLTTVPVIVIVNVVFSPEFYWFWFSVLGWGVVIAAHAIATYGFPFLGKDWEEKKMNDLMDKMDNDKEERTRYE